MLSKRLACACRPWSRAGLILIGATACAQPIATSTKTHDVDAVSVAHLQALTEEITGNVGAGGSAAPASTTGPILSEAHAFHRQISPAVWSRLEAEARPQLPALVAEVARVAKDE